MGDDPSVDAPQESDTLSYVVAVTLRFVGAVGGLAGALVSANAAPPSIAKTAATAAAANSAAPRCRFMVPPYGAASRPRVLTSSLSWPKVRPSGSWIVFLQKGAGVARPRRPAPEPEGFDDLGAREWIPPAVPVDGRAVITMTGACLIAVVA